MLMICNKSIFFITITIFKHIQRFKKIFNKRILALN